MLERPDSGAWPLQGNNASNDIGAIDKIVDVIWASDRWQVMGDLRLRFTPMGSDVRLADSAPDPMKVYDVAWLAYNSPRRKPIADGLSRWKAAPSLAWGQTRDRILRSSRTMAYVHQTPVPIGAPLRFALAAAYKLPLISERLAAPEPLLPGRDYIEAPYEKFLDALADRLSDGNLLPFGANLHHTLCVERNFRICVEQAVRRDFE